MPLTAIRIGIMKMKNMIEILIKERIEINTKSSKRRGIVCFKKEIAINMESLKSINPN